MPGADTSRYGGNSSCLEISAPGEPSLVLDCGTGARLLGRDLLIRQASSVYVLFTHFHMDHLFGFPFFTPIFTPSCQVHVSVPAYSSADAQNKLGRYLNGIYHPLRIHDVAAKLAFEGIRPGRPFDRGPYHIKAAALHHPGGSCGYRVEYGSSTMAYLTDTAPLSRPDEGLCADRPVGGMEARVIETIRDADVLVMDTMFSYPEYLEKMTWGHAYPDYAVRLAAEAGVKKVVLFHHAPDASDAEMDELAEQWAVHINPEVVVAREGMELEIGAP